MPVKIGRRDLVPQNHRLLKDHEVSCQGSKLYLGVGIKSTKSPPPTDWVRATHASSACLWRQQQTVAGFGFRADVIDNDMQGSV